MFHIRSIYVAIFTLMSGHPCVTPVCPFPFVYRVRHLIYSGEKYINVAFNSGDHTTKLHAGIFLDPNSLFQAQNCWPSLKTASDEAEV